jgi:putative lipoprotein
MRGVLLVFSVASLRAPPSGDGWFSVDKAQHFFSSAFVQSLGYGVLRRTGLSHGAALGGASIATAAVGVGKEIYDSRTGGDASIRDLVWDAAGAGAMTLLLTHTAR